MLVVQLECQDFVREENFGYVVRASCRYGKSFRVPKREADSNLYWGVLAQSENAILRGLLLRGSQGLLHIFERFHSRLPLVILKC